MKILIADDERISRHSLAEVLRGWGHEVVCAEDGVEAWDRLCATDDFSLLITDWVMPRLDGLALCRRVREARLGRYLPIILTTSLDQTEHLVEGLGAGADAFVIKPVRPPVLLAQMRTVERVIELEARLETRYRDLEQANQRIREDLEAAVAVQRSHLPSEAPHVPGVEFSWVYEACQTLGGDMFNVFRLDEQHVGVYVLDVSGHGTSAALVSVSISRVLVPFPQQGGILKRRISAPPHYEIAPPAEVAAELNRRFPLIDESGHYCTLLYGVLQIASRRFRYVSAGHPGPIELTRDGVCVHQQGGGVPIGVLPDIDYLHEEIQLAPGSRVLLHTDGVSDAANPRGERFGERRILDVLEETGPDGEPLGVAAAVHTLRKRLAEFSGGERPRDDITIVGFGVA